MTFEQGVRAMSQENFDNTIRQWTEQEKRLRDGGHVVEADKQAEMIAVWTRVRNGGSVCA